jgi:putative ABC transport system permease protein
VGTLFQDLRFAFRQFRKAPSFTVTALLTLALGIGANTAIFSLVNSILLKPPAMAHPSQITTLAFHQNDGQWQGTFSWPEFKEIRAQAQNSFSDIIAGGVGLDGLALAGQAPERIMTGYVSGNFFDALGVQPAAGRLFLSGEGEVPGRDPVIVLSYDLWQGRFNGDPHVVGRQVTVDGQSLTIVGVAPKGFTGLFGLANIAAYLPLSELTIEGTPANLLNSWQNRTLGVHGILRPGVSLKQAGAELSVVAQNITRLHPDAEKKFDVTVVPGPRLRITAIYVISALFLGLAGMVLLLACVNVANLVLVRATVREREMAIRTALGARRSRLLRQMITESILLALMGGAMGVVLGMWASTALGQVDLRTGLPVSLSLQLDWRIFLYSFSIALLAGVVVGIVPALRLAKANVTMVLHQGGRGVTAGRHWFRDSLVTLQVAGSLVLLVVAGLFVRSLLAFQTTDFGFNPDHVLNVSLNTSEIGLTDAQTHDLANQILARLHQLAGVTSVSHATATPMGVVSEGGTDTVLIDGAPTAGNGSERIASYNAVSSEYFKVMGIDILRGRSFTDADDDHGRDVAVISESTARKYWPNQVPIGQTFRLAQEKDRRLEVVGIARDAEFTPFDGGKSRPSLYLPYEQHVKGTHFMVFQVKTQGDPLALAATVSKTIHTLAPQLPIFQVETQRQGLYTLNGLLIFQAGAALAAIMGCLGLTLAVIGIYGVISYAVSQRVHEIGLRMALGATRGSVFKMIYRQSMRIVAVGLGLGLVIAMLAARAVGSFVIVSAWDPATYLIVVTALTLAALASCYLPVRRAMAVDPMVALHQD